MKLPLAVKLLGAGLLAATAYQGFNYAKDKAEEFFNGLSVEPAFAKFTKESLNLFSTRFNLGMKVFNLSNFEVPIKSITAKIYADGELIASIAQPTNIKLPAVQKYTVSMFVTASNLGVLTTLFKIYNSGKTPKLEIKGTIFTPFGSVPLELSFPSITVIKK